MHDYLTGIKEYLLSNGYDYNVRKIVLDTFEVIIANYDSYKRKVIDLPDLNIILNKYIKNLKDTSEITLVNDINNDEEFLSLIQPNKEPKLSFGYILDKQGRYVATNNNPQYICSNLAVTTKETKRIKILYDEATKERHLLLAETMMHELRHIDQTGFKVPWFVINSNLFYLWLKEGNALDETGIINQVNHTIPFDFNQEKKVFESSVSSNYTVYRYLYFKLRTLLGYQFMDEWSNATNDSTLLSRVCEKLDTTYGEGTFISIYTNMCIILGSINNPSLDDLNDLFETQKLIKEIYFMEKDKSEDEIADERDDLQVDCIDIMDALNDEALFRRNYERHVEGMMYSTFLISKDIKQVINNQEDASYNEEKHRIELEEKLKTIRKQLEVIKDVNFFVMIVSANFDICKKMISDPESLTKAIVNLESLIAKCLMKDLDKENSGNINSFNRYLHYILTVKNDKFSNSVMKDNLTRLFALAMKADNKIEELNLNKNEDFSAKEK